MSGQRYLDENADGKPDVAGPTPPRTPVSPKVIAATIAAFLAPALYLTIGYLTTDEGKQIYAGLHPVLRIFIGGVISSAAVALSSYVKRDRLREAGARAMKP